MNALLILDKPAGMTSHDVVNRVRRITGEQQVGHLGTLDPMATGVLPLLLGKWTRLAQYFGRMDKSYTGTIRFGFATDTYDFQGVPVGSIQTVALNLAQLQLNAAAFEGESLQMPPVFSAKKVAGKTAHALARAGKPPELKPARVDVASFAILGVDDDCAQFEVKISAGGYVRSLAHDLGARTGCVAHLASLRRISS